jgi:hypothetical protein
MADFNESIRITTLGSAQILVVAGGTAVLVAAGTGIKVAGIAVGGIVVGTIAVAGRTVEVGKRIGVGVSS